MDKTAQPTSLINAIVEPHAVSMQDVLRQYFRSGNSVEVTCKHPLPQAEEKSGACLLWAIRLQMTAAAGRVSSKKFLSSPLSSRTWRSMARELAVDESMQGWHANKVQPFLQWLTSASHPKVQQRAVGDASGWLG